MSDKDFIVKNSIIANANFKANSTAVYLGDLGGLYATANSTVYTGTANNTMYVNVTPVSAVVNSTTLTANLANYARLDNLNDLTPAIFVQNVEVRAASLIINTSSKVIANNGPGVAGQSLLSNGTGVYWSTITGSTITAPGSVGSNTYIIYNNEGGFGAAQAFTFDKVSNTIAIGNSTVNATINSTIYSGTANNAAYLGAVAADQYQLNSTLAANIVWMTAGDSNKLGGTAAVNYLTTAGDKTVAGQLTLNGGANLTFTNGSSSEKIFANTTNVYFTGVAYSVLNVGDTSATNIVTSSQLSSSLSYYAPKDTPWDGTQYSLANRNIRQIAGLFYSNNNHGLLGESWKESGVYGICHNVLHDINDTNDPYRLHLERFGCGVVGEVRSDCANSIGVLGSGNNGPGTTGSSNRNHGVVGMSQGNSYCWGIVSNCDPYDQYHLNNGYASPDSSGTTAGGLLAISNTSTAISGVSKTGKLLDLYSREYYNSKFFRVFNDGSSSQTGSVNIQGSGAAYRISDCSAGDWQFYDGKDPDALGTAFSGNPIYNYTMRMDDGKFYFGMSDSDTPWSYGVTRFSIDAYGNALAAGNVGAYSDVKLKKDIVTIDNALDKVSKMRGVMFTRKDNDQKGTGVIAQEIQEILPEVVGADSDGTLNVAYGNIVGVLIEAIKELKAEIEQLKGK